MTPFDLDTTDLPDAVLAQAEGRDLHMKGTAMTPEDTYARQIALDHAVSIGGPSASSHRIVADAEAFHAFLTAADKRTIRETVLDALNQAAVD